MPDKIMTRENFASLLTPVHKKIFFDSYKEKPCQYAQVFKKDTMRAKQQTYPHLGALGAWKKGAEGKPLNISNFKESAKSKNVIPDKISRSKYLILTFSPQYLHFPT